MYAALTLVCRVVLWVSARIVPGALLEDWNAEWSGNLLRWMLDAAKTGERESVHGLLVHTRQAFAAAFDARFHTDLGISEVRRYIGTPRFCLTLCFLPLAVVLIVSFGLSHLRELANGLPYPEPDGVVVLAQGPPIFGVRLGFNDRELKRFTEHTKTTKASASYVWRSVALRTDHSSRDVQAAYVSPGFFEVLGVHFYFRQPDEFFVSHAFWKQTLRGDPNVVGRYYAAAGRPMRLAAVLPANFTFLNHRTDIWLPQEADLTPPPAKWWMGLKGAVARLNPGVTPNQTATELHDLLVQVSLARKDFRMQATPIGDLVFAQFWSYLSDLGIAIGIVLLWALGGFLFDRQNGMPARLGRRYWGFLALKPIPLLIALFLYLFEFTSVNALGMTGGVQGRGGVFLTWGTFIAATIILIGAWRDQPGRCRVCLHRMRQPLRIGTPGQILLETSGEEVLCPHGHGSVYTAESVLGSEISKRWMGFEEDAFK